MAPCRWTRCCRRSLLGSRRAYSLFTKHLFYVLNTGVHQSPEFLFMIDKGSWPNDTKNRSLVHSNFHCGTGLVTADLVADGLGGVVVRRNGINCKCRCSAAGVFCSSDFQYTPDEKHLFGHKKAEYLSAVAEGVLIVLAAFLIIREAVLALPNPHLEDAPLLGIVVNVIATGVNGAWAYPLFGNCAFPCKPW